MQYRRAGNSTPLTDAQAELAARNVRLVFVLAKRMVRDEECVRHLGHDQAVSDGFLALLKAARQYDSRRSRDANGFAAYACRAIRTEVRRAAVRWSRLARLPEKLLVLPGRVAAWYKRKALRELYARGWMTTPATAPRRRE